MTELVNPGQREMLILYSRPRLSSNREREKRERKRERIPRKTSGNRGLSMSQKLDNTMGRQGRAGGSISPKTMKLETEPDCKQGPKRCRPCCSLAEPCRPAGYGQRGGTHIGGVDIDRTGESGEAGYWLHRWSGQRERDRDRKRKCISETGGRLMLLTLLPWEIRGEMVLTRSQDRSIK